MAVLGRRKRAIAQGWNAINKQREEVVEKLKNGKEEKKISQKEHEERLKKLREIGLLK